MKQSCQRLPRLATAAILFTVGGVGCSAALPSGSQAEPLRRADSGNGNNGNGNNGNGNNGNGNHGGGGRISTLEFQNANGTLRTYTDNPNVSLQATSTSVTPFFQSLGSNGRSCVHCHVPGDAWGLSAQTVAYRFTHPLDITSVDCLSNIQSCNSDPNPASYGKTDPIFRLVDGSNSPTADISTPAARKRAFSMLLTKALIRVELPIPGNAEFDLIAVDDPYRYASARGLSLFRRPLPSANLRLSPTSANPAPQATLTAVMWDGRETLPQRDIIFDLMDQANGATLGHAQAAAGLSAADRTAIVDFETGLHTAQSVDSSAGPLNANGATGGPDWLALNQPFYVGINDVLAGDAKTGAPFDPDVFTLYKAWEGSQDSGNAQIARGEALFNRKPIAIRGVGGLNDALGVDTIAGHCTTCHDTPNYGHHSVKLPINIGTADAARRTPDLPLYTLRNRQTGAVVQTSDPGRALISGKWADVGKFKGPILRGLASRPPFFHNGMAATLDEVVRFYDSRFAIGFTAQERADLAAFLAAL